MCFVVKKIVGGIVTSYLFYSCVYRAENGMDCKLILHMYGMSGINLFGVKEVMFVFI